jgi:hypothetical protein
MTDITSARINVQQEEVAYRASVSENTFSRIGSSINFINKRQFDVHELKLNGPYQIGVGLTGLDGLYIFPGDGEIVAMAGYNLINGSSGTTTIDIHRLTGPGVDAGSIFSTKPSFATTAGNDAYFLEDFLNSTTVVTGTGITVPVLNITDFNAGDALRIDLDAAQNNAENCGLAIYFRPR